MVPAISPVVHAHDEAIFVVAWVALSTTVFLLPLAVWFAVRWSLLAPVVALDH